MGAWWEMILKQSKNKLYLSSAQYVASEENEA